MLLHLDSRAVGMEVVTS